MHRFLAPLSHHHTQTVMLWLIALCALTSLQAQDPALTKRIDDLRRDVSSQSSRVCGVPAPSDPAEKKRYDDHKQALVDDAAALIAALDQEKAALTGDDIDTALRKQQIDDEEKLLKQDCPALPPIVQKAIDAIGPSAPPSNPSNPGTQPQVTVNPSGALDFDPQTIGTKSDAKQVTITNQTGQNTGLTVWYEGLPNYSVTDNTCDSVLIPNQATCSFKVAFAPKEMRQRNDKIWIIQSSGWIEYQGLWSKVYDASKELDDHHLQVAQGNKKIAAARKGKPDAANVQQENETFCKNSANALKLAADPELRKACDTVINASKDQEGLKKAKDEALKAIEAKRHELRQNALAVIPLSGTPIHWKYPLTRGVVGIDLSAVSSQTLRQAYFVDFNLLAPFKLPGVTADKDALENRLWVWLNPRITSLPKATDFSALSTIDESGTFFTNFSSQATTSSIPQGFDVNGGLEFALVKPRDGILWWAEYVNTQARLGASLIIGAGISTPFSVDKTDVPSQVNQGICDAFNANATLKPGAAPATVSGPGGLVCTFPTDSTGKVTSNDPVLVVPNPINPATTAQGQFINFVTPERSRFFRRYYAGFRLKTYFFSPDVKGECSGRRKDCPAPYDIFPGIIDVTVGQDEAVTAGKLRSVLFRVEGVYPLPFYPGLHIFGTIYSSFKADHADFPLNSFAITTPANGASNDFNTFRFPTPPLNRDYFRIGIGVDLIQVFKKGKGGQPTSATAATPATQNGNAPPSTPSTSNP